MFGNGLRSSVQLDSPSNSAMYCILFFWKIPNFDQLHWLLQMPLFPRWYIISASFSYHWLWIAVCQSMFGIGLQSSCLPDFPSNSALECKLWFLKIPNFEWLYWLLQIRRELIDTWKNLQISNPSNVSQTWDLGSHSLYLNRTTFGIPKKNNQNRPKIDVNIPNST